MAANQSMRRSWRFKDITGNVYGRLTVLRYSHTTSGALWVCACECGNETVVLSRTLRKGITVSCGCYGRERRLAATTKHSATTGRVNKSEYVSWTEMKSRCTNPKASFFSYYGGRGIKVCDRWMNSFTAFMEDMGEKPSPSHTLDRIDSNGDYTPENCRWATRKEQLRNTSRTVLIEFRGEVKCRTDWAASLGMSAHTLRYRIREWGIERAMTTPVNTNLRKRK